MKEEPRPTSWWHTLPGMLTAFAGVITAVTGLLIALNQLGVFPANDEAVASRLPATEAEAEAPAGVESGAPTPAEPGPSATSVSPGVPILEPTLPEVRVGEGRYQILAIRSERNDLQRYSMTISIRLFNEGRYDIGFWDSSFRLLIDSIPRAPVSGLSTTVAGRSAKDGEIRFAEIPIGASSLVLSISEQEAEALIPLRISRP